MTEPRDIGTPIANPVATPVATQAAPATLSRTALPWIVLVTIGIAWGGTGPLAKLAVSTGNHPIGISFWTAAIAAALYTTALALTGRPPRLGRRHLAFFVICGLLGTAVPNVLSYTAYQHLPVGVMSLVIALVPMATLMLALPLRIEPPEPRRLAGIALGAAAVAMIVLPDASLPDPGQAAWVALPVIVTLSYAGENIYIATSRPPDCNTLTITCGLSWAALAMFTPMVLATGTWVDLARLGPPEIAVIATAMMNVCAYFGFVWLIGRAGPVFAAQVAYVVTASGVSFGMLFYGERPSAWMWGAVALMFAGLTLVKPRR